jgi:hypothetical protein
VDMTAHSDARHTSWISVYRCIRSVFTWGTHSDYGLMWWITVIHM